MDQSLTLDRNPQRNHQCHGSVLGRRLGWNASTKRHRDRHIVSFLRRNSTTGRLLAVPGCFVIAKQNCATISLPRSEEDNQNRKHPQKVNHCQCQH